MKLTVSALAVLALTAGVSAKKQKASKVSSAVASSTGPVTVKDPAAAQASVLSAMSAQSPTPTPVTSTKKHKSTTHAAATTSHVVSIISTTTHSTLVTTTKPSSTVSEAEPSHSGASNGTSTHDLERRGASISGVYSNIPMPTATCQAMTNYGYSYVPADSSPSGFLKDAQLNATAYNASTPAGYTWNYVSFYDAVQAPSYMTYAQLSSYNPAACAAFCNATTGCNGFDIYFERDPTVLPGAGCPNPSVQTGVHCALYSTGLNYTWATNVGQWNSQFMVIVTGANGYSKIGAPAASSSSSSTSTSSSGSVSVSGGTNPFTIVSAFYGNLNITALAQTNFLVNGGLTINTAFPASSGLGLVNPFNTAAATSMTVTILYTWGTETRVFSALENSGNYTQGAVAWSSTTSPGTTLIPTSPPTSSKADFSVVAATYGGVQLSATTLASVYTWFSGTTTTLTSALVGSSVATTDNSLVMFYKLGTSSTISTIAINQGSNFVAL